MREWCVTGASHKSNRIAVQWRDVKQNARVLSGRSVARRNERRTHQTQTYVSATLSILAGMTINTYTLLLDGLTGGGDERGNDGKKKGGEDGNHCNISYIIPGFSNTGPPQHARVYIPSGHIVEGSFITVESHLCHSCDRNIRPAVKSRCGTIRSYQCKGRRENERASPEGA